MGISSILKKSINNMLNVKKTDAESANAPLFIQNITDEQNGPEDKEEFIIDIPEHHSKLKKKSEEENVKSEAMITPSTKSDKTDLPETETVDSASHTATEAVKTEVPDLTENGKADTPESKPIDSEINVETASPDPEPVVQTKNTESADIESADKIEKTVKMRPEEKNNISENSKEESADDATAQEIQKLVTAVIKEHFPEIKKQETTGDHQAPQIQSQMEIKSIDLGDISIQTRDLTAENKDVIAENPLTKKKKQKKNKKKEKSHREQTSETPETSLPEKTGLSDLSQKELSPVFEAIKVEATPDTIHQNEDPSPSAENNSTLQDDQNKDNALCKFKKRFSVLKTSGFFKRKDFKCGVGVFLLCLVILTGSIITSKKPVSSETFASLAAESGLTVTDITSAFSETMPGVVSSHTAISETGWTADFDVFTNGDIAEQNLEKNVEIAAQYKNDSLLEKESNRNNIRIYSLASSGYFFYIARIDHTLLSIAALDSNREAAETFITKLGYQQ